ncbi:MAG: Fe-S cluster assembly protein SufD, partial [Cyanobacteria bacterium P01_A01_bin.70]
MAIQVSSIDPPTQLTKREQRAAYLKALLGTLQANVPEAVALTDLRAQAAAIANEHTFPTTRDEDWRFTDLSAMLSVPFQATPAAPDVDATALAAIEMPEAIARIVLVNGQFSAELSDLAQLPAGVVVGNLAALQTGAMADQLTARLAQSSGGHDLFNALNTVGFP